MAGINVLLALMIIASFLVAIPLHELGHVLMASWLGDRTPITEGRRTLSLRPHIDSLGLVLCILLAFGMTISSLGGVYTTAAGIGWGKPVKSDPWKLRSGPNSGTLIVALGGIVFSLLIGLLVAGIIRVLGPAFLQGTNSDLTIRLFQLFTVFASVNVCIALFNLIPFYPLDGYQILYSLLPSKQAIQFQKTAAYGPLIILAIFFALPWLLGIMGIPFAPGRWILQGSFSLMSLLMGGSAQGIENLYGI